MGLESATFIDDLVPSNPIGASDLKSQGDDHLRMLKDVLQNTFPVADKAFYFPRIITKATDYTVLTTDENAVLAVSTTGAVRTITLPTLTANDDGWQITIVRYEGAVNNVVVSAASINGATTFLLEYRYHMVRFVWTGSLWLASAIESPNPFRIVTKTADATLTAQEMNSVLLVSPAATTTIQLPAASTATKGNWVYVKNLVSGQSVIIDPIGGGVTVDGATTITLDSQFEAVLLVCDGVVWHILTKYEVLTIPSQPVNAAVDFRMEPNAVTPNSKIDIHVDEVVMSLVGSSVRHPATNLTLDFSLGGSFPVLNGRDANDAMTNSEWYIWLISNGVTLACIAHKSTAADPTMPAGYIYKMLVGWAKGDGSGDLYRIIQKGELAQYVVGTIPSVPVPIATGVVGTYHVTDPALTQQALATLVPSHAKAIMVMATNRWKGNGPHGVLVAPNNDYEGTNRGPKGSAGVVYPIWLTDTGASNASEVSVTARMLLESASVWFAGNGTGSGLFVLGWEAPLQ